jgi:predicted methyltransferase
VLEYNPGGGWYTEILAPLLKGNGHYIAYGSARGEAPTTAMLAGKADWFGSTRYIGFDPATGTYPEPGTVDRALTFRNVHNLLMAGNAQAEAAFRAFFAALKPGGILGVVDHRLPETSDSALERSSGYIKRSTIIGLAERAGFKLAGESQVNANPRDDHDHPDGVWSLPPTYKGGDTDRAKYAAIGESDRLTLKFVKPQ